MMEIVSKYFGNCIKKLRIKKGLTQKELAEEVGKSHSSISGYENGLNEPRESAIIKFADFFDVSSDFLLGIVTKE